MKLHYLHKGLSSNIKFSFHKEKEFLKLWHHHPELEIVYILQGTGTIYAGDYIGNYQKNDLFLIGKNVPHMFHSKLEEEEEFSESYVFHINEVLLNNNFVDLPEFSFLKNIMDISKRGVLFRSKQNLEVLDLLDSLEETSLSENTIKVYLLLLKLSSYKEFITLGSINWLRHAHVSDRRINKVIEYVMLHFQQEISLEEISEISGMNKSAFCRFFKKSVGKSFISFLNETRINYSCKILLESTPRKTVSEACYKSGFNSLSYYNRTFKKLMKISPSRYQVSTIDVLTL